jgi:hypothetical protein
MDVCRSQVPPTVTVAPGHVAACWLHVDPAQRRVNQNGSLTTIAASDPSQPAPAAGGTQNQ